MNETETPTVSPVNDSDLNQSPTLRWCGTAAIGSIGVIAGGYLLGDGLLRA